MQIQRGGRLKVVKSVTVPGKCFAISDGDRPGDPYFFSCFCFWRVFFPIVGCRVG